MHKLADLHELDLTDEQLAAISIPKSEEALHYYAWLSRYIEYSADAWPSRHGNIHIPNLDKKVVWKEYKDDMIKLGQRYVSYTRFCELWQILFPTVKKKPKYGVMGHCDLCSTLTDLRNQQTDPRILER